MPGKTINEDGMVAGGSLVTKDVASEEIWQGVPAKCKTKVPEAQLLKNNMDEK